MSRSVWALALMFLASGAGAPQGKPGVPDIPAMQTLWASLKVALTGPNGQEYFERNLKESDIPYLYGIVLSSTPKDQPRVLVLAMSDRSTPEVTLKVTDNGHMKEPVPDGTEVIFKGVPTEFSRQPFRLTFETLEAVRVHEPHR
jgi:hypothetical protein